MSDCHPYDYDDDDYDSSSEPQFGTFPADQILDVYLNVSKNLLDEGFKLNDIIAAITLAAADLTTNLRDDH